MTETELLKEQIAFLRTELEKANKEIKRLDNENAALRKMLTATALEGKQGW